MKYLLDTCALIDANDANILGRLPGQLRSLLLHPDNDLLMSSVSVTEMAIKTGIGKLYVGDFELVCMVRNLSLQNLAYTVSHAKRLYALPMHHRDPFDRMLIATAIEDGVPIISRDEEFFNYLSDGLQLIDYRLT